MPKQSPSTPGIEWVDPPPPKTIGKYDDVIAALRQNPGQWAVIRRNIRTANGSFARSLKRRGLEATQRSNADGTTDVYARYVGEDG